MIKDLSGRIPYRHNFWLQVREFDEDAPSNRRMLTKYIDDIYTGWVVDCKPYLRPMETMTEEERKELKKLMNCDYVTYSSLRYTLGGQVDYDDFLVYYEESSKLIDWLNKNMFDYRGLIEKGLALEAIE